MRINLEFELKYCVAVTNKNRPAAVISWYEKLIRLTSTFQSCYNKMLISRWQPSYHLPLSPMWGRFTHDAAFQSSIASLAVASVRVPVIMVICSRCHRYDNFHSSRNWEHSDHSNMYWGQPLIPALLQLIISLDFIRNIGKEFIMMNHRKSWKVRPK